MLVGLGVVPERQAVSGQQLLGGRPAHPRLEGRRQRLAVDRDQAVHPAQVERRRRGAGRPGARPRRRRSCRRRTARPPTAAARRPPGRGPPRRPSPGGRRRRGRRAAPRRAAPAGRGSCAPRRARAGRRRRRRTAASPTAVRSAASAVAGSGRAAGAGAACGGCGSTAPTARSARRGRAAAGRGGGPGRPSPGRWQEGRRHAYSVTHAVTTSHRGRGRPGPRRRPRVRARRGPAPHHPRRRGPPCGGQPDDRLPPVRRPLDARVGAAHPRAARPRRGGRARRRRPAERPRAARRGGSAHVVERLAHHPLWCKVLDLDPELLLPLVVDRFGSSQRAIVERVAEQVVAGQADGSVRSGDPILLATCLLLTAQSFVFSARVISPSTRARPGRAATAPRRLPRP